MNTLKSEVEEFTTSNDETFDDIELLHDIGSRIAASDPFHLVLRRIIKLITQTIRCDSCFIYVLEKDNLILRASKNSHNDAVDRIGLALGEGITGWVAMHHQPVAIAAHAADDPRFAKLISLPEDRFEAFLSVPILSRGKLVGVINIQHRQPHTHTRREIQLITTLGYLVGAEIELARIEFEKSRLADQLETRKIMDRAKGILQRETGMDEESAYIALQKQSRQSRRPLREIAEAIILTEDMRRFKK